MEARRLRPKFYDPFTSKKNGVKKFHPFLGFFRSMPFRRWNLYKIEHVLDFTARNPVLFGFPDAPTAILNPAYFLPGMRSKKLGASVFGVERGCKTIVIPNSCSGESYDKMDVRMMAPLFRWNPSVEMLYLSRECENVYEELAPLLGNLRSLHTIVLCGWKNAQAIHKICIVCKKLEVIDAYYQDSGEMRDWANPLSVQALSTLIEMHPKLRLVEANHSYLTEWSNATDSSRCKHHIAMIPVHCGASAAFYTIWVLLFVLPLYSFHKKLYLWITADWESYKWEFSVVMLLSWIFIVGLVVYLDRVSHRHTWSTPIMELVVLRNRLYRRTWRASVN